VSDKELSITDFFGKSDLHTSLKVTVFFFSAKCKIVNYCCFLTFL